MVEHGLGGTLEWGEEGCVGENCLGGNDSVTMQSPPTFSLEMTPLPMKIIPVCF